MRETRDARRARYSGPGMRGGIAGLHPTPAAWGDPADKLKAGGWSPSTYDVRRVCSVRSWTSSNFDDVDVPGVLLYPGRVLALSYRDPYYVYVAAGPPGANRREVERGSGLGPSMTRLGYPASSYGARTHARDVDAVIILTEWWWRHPCLVRRVRVLNRTSTASATRLPVMKAGTGSDMSITAMYTLGCRSSIAAAPANLQPYRAGVWPVRDFWIEPTARCARTSGRISTDDGQSSHIESRVEEIRSVGRG
ncbi:hypothetical protein C8Q70DRAFT_934989 [Cubamyces menziesii]|nr:hypothetical protein C8Q70DRAFT_934989 [Cubamyces menziesii]